MMVEALFNESSEQIIIFNRLGNLEFINKKAEETLKSVHLLSNFWSNTDKNNSEWERFIRTVIENSTSSTTLFLVNKYHQKMQII